MLIHTKYKEDSNKHETNIYQGKIGVPPWNGHRQNTGAKVISRCLKALYGVLKAVIAFLLKKC